MKIGVPAETQAGEARIALTPDSALQLQVGHECLIQKGAGIASGFTDEMYSDAGVKIIATAALFKQADIILKVHAPTDAENKAAGQHQDCRQLFLACPE